MRCHVCNVAVGDGQRFCHECGESLDGVTDPTAPVDVIPDAADIADRVDAADAMDASNASGAVPDDALTAADPSAPGWWADAPPSPPVDGPLPPTDDPAPGATAELAATEEFDAFDAPATAAVAVATTGLDPVHDEHADPLPAPSVTGHEPTTTMPAGAGPEAGALRDTDELPSQYLAGAPLFDGVADVDEYTVPPSEGFRLRASLVFGVLAVVATLMVSVADVIDIRTSRPVDGISVGIRVLDDFGGNLPVAGFIGAAVMLVGGLLSCFGLRVGAGIAGGAGLALAGWAAMTIGLVEVPIHSAEGITRNAGADINGFTLEITRDLGWFLLAAIGVIGIIVFLTTLRMAGTGGRPGLNPWVAAIGALGAVILAVGPLIVLPFDVATLDLNLGFVGLPRAFFAGRIVMLSLIAFTGILGFLSVRTYGLGLAGGGMAIATWLWTTAIADVGDDPVGVAVGNLGTVDTTPHAVTTVGLALSVMMLVVASALAIVTRPRRQ
jgi:hypothetical protein